MLFIKKYKPPKNNTKESSHELNNRSSLDEIHNSSSQMIYNPKISRNLLICLMATCLGCYGALELGYFQFSSTYYQYIALKLSASKSAQILSVMATTCTIGRCVSALIAFKIKPEIMLMYHYLIIILSILGLYFGQNYEVVIWVGNATIGIQFN